MKNSLYLAMLVCGALLGCTKHPPQLHVLSADRCERPSIVGTIGNLKYSLNVAHPSLAVACPGVLGMDAVGKDYRVVSLSRESGELTLQVDGENKELEIDHVEEVSK